MIRNTALFSFILLTASTAIGMALSSSDAAKKLHALFEEDWQWGLQQYPEGATFLGDNRYNDRLTDYSPEAIERRKAHEREMLDRIQKISRAELTGQDVISYDLYLRDKKLNVEGLRFPTEYMPIDQMNGVQITFGQLAASTPFRAAKDYEDYLARLAAFPKQIDQLIALMKRGVETKWIQPAVPLRSLAAQIEGQITDDPARSTLFKPFEAFPENVSEADRSRLSAAGKKTIAGSFTPAMKKLAEFIKQTYLPAARSNIGASALPEGQDYYQYSIRRHTTTNLTAKEIHEIGVKEVARIRKEMEGIIQKVGFKGSFQEFLTFLRTDPRFYYTNAEDLVARLAISA